MPYIDDAFIEELKAQMSADSGPHKSDENEQAFKRVLNLASRREQATKLLRARLLREAFSPAAVEYALERAQSCGLIDDNRYASTLARGRLAAQKGIQGIERELEELEISVCLQELLPDQNLDDESECKRALAVLERKPPTAKNKREGAYRKLLSKGYASAIASRASRIWCEKTYHKHIVKR